MNLVDSMQQPVMGNLCQKRRIKAKISVADFAEKTGYTRQSIYNFENGRTQSLQLFREYLKIGGEYGEN